MHRAFSQVALAATFLGAALAAPVLAPQAAQAQQAPAEEVRGEEDDDTIVVRGGRPENVSRADVHRQALDIAPTDDHLDTPLARFEGHLCPGIAGMHEEYAMLMIDRIRANAHDLGIEIQEDGCSPNFVIVFADDSQQMLQNVVDSNPQMFQYVNRTELRRMLEPGPVHVWNNVELRTALGHPVPRDRNLASPPIFRQNATHSRIYTSTRRDIASIMVIYDRDEVETMSIGQLADYATMRGLVQTKPTDDLAMNSILSLFNETGPYPERLTNFDRAYLRAVYDWIPNLPGAAKLGNVNRQLRLIAAEQSDED